MFPGIDLFSPYTVLKDYYTVPSVKMKKPKGTRHCLRSPTKRYKLVGKELGFKNQISLLSIHT